jgi:hypothetical protein
MQAYSNPKRATDPHALPDVEVFKGYRHACRDCGEEQPLFPDYYGQLYPADEPCACGHVGMRCLDTDVKWYWWHCFPGCLPDGDPIGPFATEAEALADAQGEGE